MKNLQGWMILGIACLAGCVGTTIPVQAQQTATAIVVKERLVEHVGDRLIIDMKLALDELSLPANRSLVCTPLIERGDSVRALPPVIVNGRNRQIQYDRSGRDAAANGEFVLRRYNGKEQTFDYHASIPFAKWMERSEVSLVADFCGCGWEALSNDKSPLFPIRIAEPVVLRPLLAYVTPEAERVKERVKEGSAFLDFPVNRTEIYPEYRDNPSELRKILETVSSVKEDPYATITEVYIKGFASPEGTYKHNTYLAEHRAKALIEYVKGLYHFEQARFTVDFEPEDWAGLEKRVENSSLADKEELLAATTLALQQQQEELDQNRTALTSAQDSLALQQSKIEEQAALLAAQQAQIDKLVGLRSQIIEDLRDNLSDVGQRVTVDRKTGAVTFESSVLFDTGRNEIKEAGKAALNSCIPVYIHTLLSEEYRDYVGEIIVEGHTDTTGQYLNNLALSQQRALAVATYCLSDEMVGLSYTDKETFKSIMTANGRADADPIYNADGTVNMDASRRVVIKFRMKDSDMIDQMSAILEGSAQGD